MAITNHWTAFLAHKFGEENEIEFYFFDSQNKNLL